MIENVEKFFELYEKDEDLREWIHQEELLYPGSLEIREAVAEAVLLPAAAALGLPFDLKDLRKYETRIKLREATMSDEEWLQKGIGEGRRYWLLDKGWNSGLGDD